MKKFRAVRTLPALAAVGALLTMPSLPGAASVTISIGDATFEPPVAVVSPGSTVTWRNDGSTAHAIVGRFCRAPRRLCDDQRSSPTLEPGQSFAIRFPRTGEFEYHDRFNESATGTIVVAAGGRRPPRARGNAEHRYRATISFTAHERFEFTDAGAPPCPTYVGNGERLVQWTARLPTVTYQRLPRFGIELLASPRRPVRTRLTVLRERMDARVDAGVDACSYVDLSCTNNLSGRPLWITFVWAPRETNNRFHVHNQRGRDIGWGESHCGSNAASVFGLPEAVFSALPFAIGAFTHVPQDEVLALATPAEVSRLRAGRSVRVVREFDRRWTDEFYPLFSNNPPRDNSSGTPPGPCDCGWPGNQQIFNLRAKLVITLVPRR